MNRVTTRISTMLIVSILLLSTTVCFAGNEKGQTVEEQPVPQASTEELQRTDAHLVNVCHDLNEEINAIRSCSSDRECGQILVGTSCGCTHDLVARKDANLSTFQRLKTEYGKLMSEVKKTPSECSKINFGSFCDCPKAYGFACENNICTWNYYKIEPWSSLLKPKAP